MEFKQKIQNQLEGISLDRALIKPLPPKIFLCGGKLTKPKNTEKYRFNFKKYLEKRQSSLLSKIVIAEKFEDWYQDGKYRELLTLERDIAGLSNIIVIILESAGSIAELSSFIMDKEISKKLFVIVPSKHRDSTSFIQNGILAYLRKINQNKKFVFRKPVSFRENNENEDIEKDINKALSLKTQKKTEKFNKDLHSAFVIYEMIRVYQALTFEEIEICLNKLRLKFKKTDNRIENLLFILEQFKWITKVKRGTEEFFCIDKKNRINVKIQIKNFPAEKIKADAIACYNDNSNAENDRIKLIKSL